jgi:D-alanine--poly(phosphoribitol) ligase subunit 1
MTQPYASTFVDDFFRCSVLFANEPALVFAGRITTYAELFGMVQGIRDWIDNEVPVEEQRIAVFASQGARTYAAILAILASGKAYVPLNPHSPPQRNGSCLTQADVSTLFQSGTNTEISEWVVEQQLPVTVVDLEAIPSSTSARMPIPVRETDMAYLLFTSGSTGEPKGVPLYHGNLRRFMTALLNETEFEFRQTDRFLQMFDFTFDLSIMSFAAPLAIGAACHVVTGSGVGFLEVAKTLQQGRVTVALMVPSVLSFLESYLDEIQLPEMRYSLFCGEALPALLAEKWRKCIPSARLFNVYGPTEATIFCSIYELESPLGPAGEYQGVVSIGVPMPGTIFSVLDDKGNCVSAGEKGELVISGGQVTDQYWRNKEKTRAAFFIGSGDLPAYRTGDIAFAVDGNYFYCGRADFQLKVDGYRIEAGEIEHHARGLPGVRNVALVGQTEMNRRVKLHLFLESIATEQEALRNACKAHLTGKLPSYMLPHCIHILDSFPLNQNGKVDRKALISGISQE